MEAGGDRGFEMGRTGRGRGGEDHQIDPRADEDAGGLGPDKPPVRGRREAIAEGVLEHRRARGHLIVVEIGKGNDADGGIGERRLDRGPGTAPTATDDTDSQRSSAGAVSRQAEL